MFAGLAAHFRALARGRVAWLGDDLLQKIDLGIDEVAAYAGSTKMSIAAIVGLRRTLYPDAPPYRPIQTPEPASVTSEQSPTASLPGWESVP
jgi:hypothetical protein